MKRNEYDALWGHGPPPQSGEEFYSEDLAGVPYKWNGYPYDIAEDAEGNHVYCPMQHYHEAGRKDEPMLWHQDRNVYFCPVCGYTMTRSAFFDYAGLTPPGKECRYCDDLFPGCMRCPYGYVKEEL